MSSGLVCTQCGCSEIDTDPARGDAVCTNCGSVLEDQIIVSEIQFQENSAGASSVIGQYVSSEGAKSHSMGSGFHHGFGKESRAITLQNGKKKIQELGGQLRLNQHCIETAFNFFKMAVFKRLTRGRKTAYVVAACLYLVCRTEGTPHMLLDFSDILQVNVFTLGKTYLQLSRELHINVPAIDPCLLIPRFAHKLDFGDKEHEVNMTALRLVGRMKRDWLAVGRRPSGLCGAALLVASRIHNFSRSQKDLVKVVKVCEATIRKRLLEFEDTPSSKLTIDEFQTIDLEQEADPPSFTEGRKKAKYLQQLDEQNKLGELTEEISCVQVEIEKALESKKKGTDSESASICSEDPDTSQSSSVFDDSTDQGYNKLLPTNDPSDMRDDHIVQSLKDSINDDSLDADVASLEKSEIDNVLMPPPKSPWESKLGPRPTAASLGLKESIEECMRTDTEKSEENDDGELDLNGINDAELDQFILDDEEVKRKTALWTKLNAVYIQEQKEKEEKEARDKELGILKPETKKKRKYKKKQSLQANTAGEAIEKMLQEKKISSKINYEVLKDLNKGNVKPTPERPSGGGDGTTPIRSTDAPENRLKRTSGYLQEPGQQDLPEKKPKLAQQVLVESGPVEYDKTDDGDLEGEAEDDDDYYVDDDQHLSAAQLLRQHTGVEEDYHDNFDVDD